MKTAIVLAIVMSLVSVQTAIALEPGDTLWTRTYGGSHEDWGYSVQQTSDGGYVIAGSTHSFGAGSADVYLVKTDSSGDTLWTRTYGGSVWDIGYSVQQTSDGGYIIAGRTDSFGAGYSDVYLVKTDSSGDTLWTRTYGGRDWDQARSVHQTSDGGYIIAASHPGGLWLLKTDFSGDTLWTRTYEGGGYSVQQTTDGGYIIAGGTSDDVWLLKTDSSGDSLWTRAYGGRGSDVASSVQQTSDGGYIIAGHTWSFGTGEYDVYLVRTDSSGDTLWTRTYGGRDWDQARSVQQTSDGGYIIAGETRSFGAGGDDVYLLRVAGGELPAVSIEIIPDDPPVTVPQGGSFGFSGTLTNNTDRPQVVDAGTMAIGPEKDVYGPFKKFRDLELAPYETLSAHFGQHVPNVAPLGFYSYIGYCGDYPSTVMDSSFFQIEVIQGRSTGRENLGWVLSGSFGESEQSASIPSEFALLGNYPNPFNASTVINYQLPVDTDVKLEVYNLLGQKVATLVNSKQQAGYRSVVWDASEVSSGLYLYKLTAGDYTETRRMMLVK